MSNRETRESGGFQITRIRPAIFTAAAILHITLVLFAGFRVGAPAITAEPAAGVMRLIDAREAPPTPPAPPPELPPAPPQSARAAFAETIAENIIEESEEFPLSVSPVITPPEHTPVNLPGRNYAATGQTEYLRHHQVSVLPVLPENEIARAIVYPPIARRLNIEGEVVLELFIDRHGAITNLRVIRESPPDRGFAAAALNAFTGIRAVRPAEVNGAPVAARFQYSLRFTLR